MAHINKIFCNHKKIETIYTDGEDRTVRLVVAGQSYVWGRFDTQEEADAFAEEAAKGLNVKRGLIR